MKRLSDNGFRAIRPFKRPHQVAITPRRTVHSTQTSQASSMTSATPGSGTLTDQHVQAPPPTPPLARLPLSDVVRNLLMTSITSSPLLLRACFSILSQMLASNSAFMDINRNPTLRSLLRNTFYKQYCTGATREEMQKTIDGLRNIGYNGIILEYALEVLESDRADGSSSGTAIEKWRKGMLESLDMTLAGDYVGLKWSGMGTEALDLLNHDQTPTPDMERAMREVCSLAASKRISLLPGAEESKTNKGLQTWSLMMQKEFNRNAAERAVVYHTYQAYLKAAPSEISRALEFARHNDFTLGVKLVRGAYLGSEPPHLLCKSKQETDDAYDAIAEQLLRKRYGGILKPLNGSDNAFPQLNLVFGTHNAISLTKAQTIRNEQMAQGEQLVPTAYAQLQGMADELSCSLLQSGAGDAQRSDQSANTSIPQVYKCTVWGPMEDCLNFLLRRAEENKEAAYRTLDTRNAMASELLRRVKARLGFA